MSCSMKFYQKHFSTPKNQIKNNCVALSCTRRLIPN
uniref:Uncharacterized protein n=1 Tax=Arundo donax TaxID=35708 RepID=A0A0A9BZB1_ARUDO